MTMIDGLHRPNLQKLATYLYYGEQPEGVEFDMEQYTADEYESMYYTHCHTAGCAVGHAPFAGIQKLTEETFDDYSTRTLINDTSPDAWSWCFSGWWARWDNTREGAARRIQYLLDNGVPEQFDFPPKDYAAYLSIYADTVVQPYLTETEVPCPLNCTDSNCWFCEGTGKAFIRRFNEIRKGREVMECL